MNREQASILYSLDGAVATITLNRPNKHNALGSGEIHSLTEFLQDIEKQRDIRVLLLRGNGRSFCAGAALDELAANTISPADFATLTNTLANLSIPSVCMLNGNVYGGGCELALSCDFRFARPGIKAHIPAAKIGLCYPPSGIQRLVTVMGLANAQRFLLAAESFQAEELLTMGFITHFVEEDELEHSTRQFAVRLTEHAPLALRAMKRISLKAASASKLADDKEIQELVLSCSESLDLQEGMRAAAAKRHPVFTGE